ncbi:response regulator [Woodsholea maritima]|uniref:hypothetical protein n=1 Tax=Woodsholea maritima TaxID=240237 RepID=UPI00037E4FA1|nr:hypothetical protein [Woodsholea maritima]
MIGMDLSRASVVVFDPVHINLRTTRYALHELGFRDIVCMSSIKEFKRRVMDDAPQLIIAEIANNEQEILPCIKGLRMGEMGHNPFVVTLLTCWSRDSGLLKQAIASGADDIIIRPFSTSFIEERIRTLVKARKPFIVTSDYIGPDRRTDPSRGNGNVKPIEAPNTLKAIVEEDYDALEYANAWIKEARSAVDNERLRRLSMRIVVGVEIAMRESRADRPVQIDIGDLERSAVELRQRLARLGAKDASRVAQALCEVTAALKTSEGFSIENLALAKELAMGAYAAYAGEEGMDVTSRGEIERTVESLRARIAPRMASIRDAVAKSETGSEDAA